MLWQIHVENKLKSKIRYRTVGTSPESNRTFLERG